jgi:hypothetical protein
MSVRAILNRHPVLTVGVVLLLTALAVASIVYQLRPTSEVSLIPLKDFYSVDDGETWFADDVNKITPFDHGGKPAVQVHLFTCDGGKTRFVGYLEKLPDGALEAYRSRMHVSAADVPESDEVAEVVGSLVKRKGEAEWVPSSDSERFGQIKLVRCPDGRGELEAVRPE